MSDGEVVFLLVISFLCGGAMVACWLSRKRLDEIEATEPDFSSEPPKPRTLVVRDPSMDDHDLALAILDMDNTQGQKAMQEVIARYQAEMIETVDDPSCDPVGLKERLATLRNLIVRIDQWADAGVKIRKAAQGE
jgi:hypothetical protein